MILDHSPRAIINLGNDISPISLSGHGVKKFSVLITKLHNPLGESLLFHYCKIRSYITNICRKQTLFLIGIFEELDKWT
jgi:hypothetical protein